MQVQAQLFAGLADGFELFGLIDAADFRGLGQRDYAGFRIVDVGAFERDFTDGIRRQLAVFAACGQQFGAVGEKFRCAAFVRFNVGRFRADDAVVTLAER